MASFEASNQMQDVEMLLENLFLDVLRKVAPVSVVQFKDKTDDHSGIMFNNNNNNNYLTKEPLYCNFNQRVNQKFHTVQER